MRDQTCLSLFPRVQQAPLTEKFAFSKTDLCPNLARMAEPQKLKTFTPYRGTGITIHGGSNNNNGN